jgi:hypothetical protein
VYEPIRHKKIYNILVYITYTNTSTIQMENGARYVMARIDLPILLRNDGSYDAMNDRAKVSFFSISELPEINNQTQISLGDLFSQLGETHSNSIASENKQTRIRLDKTQSHLSEDNGWFKKSPPPELVSPEETSLQIPDTYTISTPHTSESTAHISDKITEEQNVSLSFTTHSNTNTNTNTNTNIEPISVVKQENETPIMRIMRSEMKHRKPPTKGKTFKNYAKSQRNFTEKKYGV